MLKLNNEQIQKGRRINLSEAWHEKILKFGKLSSIPYTFIIEDIVKRNKEVYYICAGEKREKGKTVRIAITEYVAKYILGPEVPDSNVGFYFKEYLPIEGTAILITDLRNPSQVIPAILKLECELVEIEGESFITITFKIDNMIDQGIADIRYYSMGNHRSTWKFLYHEDESYMSDSEKTFKDTMVHKGYVKKSCDKLARYLEKNGALQHAKLLRERGEIHDNSKIECEDEVMALSRIINDKSSLKDASKQLSPIKKDAIALHWKHNSHHPEHFQSAMDMSKLDIMEMCCDWHARSEQYKTDFLPYVEQRQKDRFHFPDWMFQEIWHYCEVLASKI